jgi:phospholipase D1/2
MSSILRPGRNVWRIERASRAAALIDGAAFFGAVRQAFRNARRSIFIVGWDIDSRTRLVGESNRADDGYSPILAEFLGELVAARPDLQVYLLLWDYSVIYAHERELFPRLSLQWNTPSRVTLCMDDAVPFGSSQHQKLIVVDDALAFSGGLDLTLRRWDTNEHRPENPGRLDASGNRYAPFHDVQMMVDGPAARALAVLARRRWCRAYRTEPPLDPVGDPWPRDVAAHFTSVDIGIARTQPAFEEQEQVNEVEALFFDSIDHAERSIYIENQFMTSPDVAQHLARRLRDRPQLEVLAVTPRAYDSWVVARTLGNERIRFLQHLKEAAADRIRLVYPAVDDGSHVVDTTVHSKVMVIDDRLLRVGSANLNNRSMAVDTECDLVIEARSDIERAAITKIRNTLVGDHCGVGADAVASALARHGSLVAAAGRLSSNGHSLRPIDDCEPGESKLACVLADIADPRGPLTVGRVWTWGRLLASAPGAAVLAVGSGILILTLLWHFTPIAEFVTRERVQGLLSAAAADVWAPLWVLLTYLIAGLVAFPVLVLIVATAATFGPWLGFLYALMGVLSSALLTYFIGAWLGRDMLRRTLGARLNRIRQEMDERGILAVAAIRAVPVAPFTLVNLTAGACSIALVDYVVGTVIGMLPGLIAISALGHQISTMLMDFSVENVALVLLLILCWIAVAWSAQSLVRRLRRRAS